MKVVPRFFTNGGEDTLRVMEQYVMDALTMAGEGLKNDIQAIDKKRGRLRAQYRQFVNSVCK